MLTKKEGGVILLAILITAVSISMPNIQDTFLPILLSVSLVILANIGAKKAMGYYLDTEVEIDFWQMGQYGIRPQRHFKKPIPLGIVLTAVSKLFLYPFKNFVWMASLVFDVKPKIYKSAKRHGLYAFSETTEYHIGLIAAAGLTANLVFAVVGYFLNFTDFAMISIFYAFFNVIPISKLDGNKLFFGSLILWSLLASLILLGMFLVIFIV